MNKINNLPTEIFLNIGTDEEADFKQLREVTWSANRVHDSDIRYVLADPRSEVMSLEECRNKIASNFGFKTLTDLWSSNELTIEDKWFQREKAAELYASQFRTKADQLEAENERLREALGCSEPWNVIYVLEKLADAADFLLNHRDYDRTGWEEVSHCVKKAQEYGDRIVKALQQEPKDTNQ